MIESVTIVTVSSERLALVKYQGGVPRAFTFADLVDGLRELSTTPTVSTNSLNKDTVEVTIAVLEALQTDLKLPLDKGTDAKGISLSWADHKAIK